MGFFSLLKYTFIIHLFAAHLATSCGALFETQLNPLHIMNHFLVGTSLFFKNGEIISELRVKWGLVGPILTKIMIDELLMYTPDTKLMDII
jgi:hypothetical protein